MKPRDVFAFGAAVFFVLSVLVIFTTTTTTTNVGFIEVFSAATIASAVLAVAEAIVEKK